MSILNTELLPISKKQIALLHVVKYKMGWDENSYRALLSKYGAEHAAQLRQGAFKKLMRYADKLGFQYTGGASTAPIRAEPNALPTKAQLDAIDAMFSELGADSVTENGRARRRGYCQRVIQEVAPVDRRGAIKIIEALKAITARQRQREADGNEGGRKL